MWPQSHAGHKNKQSQELIVGLLPKLPNPFPLIYFDSVVQSKWRVHDHDVVKSENENIIKNAGLKQN